MVTLKGINPVDKAATVILTLNDVEDIVNGLQELAAGDIEFEQYQLDRFALCLAGMQQVKAEQQLLG